MGIKTARRIRTIAIPARDCPDCLLSDSLRLLKMKSQMGFIRIPDRPSPVGRRSTSHLEPTKLIIDHSTIRDRREVDPSGAFSEGPRCFHQLAITGKREVIRSLNAFCALV